MNHACSMHAVMFQTSQSMYGVAYIHNTQIVTALGAVLPNVLQHDFARAGLGCYAITHC